MGRVSPLKDILKYKGSSLFKLFSIKKPNDSSQWNTSIVLNKIPNFDKKSSYINFNSGFDLKLFIFIHLMKTILS